MRSRLVRSPSPKSSSGWTAAPRCRSSTSPAGWRERIDVEARIEVVGLRPGERLHERLCRDDDDVATTAFPYVLCTPVERVAPEWLDRRIAALARHAERASAAGVRAALAELREPAPVQLSAPAALAP